MKLFALAVLCTAVVSASAADKKIVLLAGSPSHGPGEHEYRAGSLLFQKCLAGVPGVNVIVVSNDWPKDEKILEGADAIVMFCTGAGGHPAVQGQRRQTLDALIQKGCGFGTMHF